MFYEWDHKTKNNFKGAISPQKILRAEEKNRRNFFFLFFSPSLSKREGETETRKG